MKKILVGSIYLYQKTLSFETGFIPRVLGIKKGTCRFYPSCSEYTKQAILKHGSFYGVILGAKRIARCNPLHEQGVDLVPEHLSFRKKVR